MSLIPLDECRPLLRCPSCRGSLGGGIEALQCEDVTCGESALPFPVSAGRPALVDFAGSVLSRETLMAGQVLRRRARPGKLKHSLRRFLFPRNTVAARNMDRFLAAAAPAGERPLVLVVGGGAIGEGAGRLYEDPSIRLISFDIYPSQDVQLIADAHAMPFADARFDAVWIQAVLEHVLEPEMVVAEIARVLRPGGVVYAETPFLQGVHEEAYDFTRFSESGHRWLFRRFARIASGAALGPFAQLLDALRGAILALSGSPRLALAVQAGFFWLKPFDRLVPERRRLDHASAVWFLGRLADRALSPQEAIANYAVARMPASTS